MKRTLSLHLPTLQKHAQKTEVFAQTIYAITSRDYANASPPPASDTLQLVNTAKVLTNTLTTILHCLELLPVDAAQHASLAKELLAAKSAHSTLIPGAKATRILAR